MGYQIIYSKGKRQFRKLNRWGRALIFSVIICAVLTVAGYFGGAKQRISPATDATGAALENMVESVRDGQKISDAIVAFCREIVANAEMPQ